MKPGLFGQLDGANPHLAVLCDIPGSYGSDDAADSSLPGCLRHAQRPGAAFEGGKWGDRPRPRSSAGPALQAYEFVKLYSPVNWKC